MVHGVWAYTREASTAEGQGGARACLPGRGRGWTGKPTSPSRRLGRPPRLAYRHRLYLPSQFTLHGQGVHAAAAGEPRWAAKTSAATTPRVNMLLPPPDHPLCCGCRGTDRAFQTLKQRITTRDATHHADHRESAKQTSFFKTARPRTRLPLRRLALPHWFRALRCVTAHLPFGLSLLTCKFYHSLPRQAGGGTNRDDSTRTLAGVAGGRWNGGRHGRQAAERPGMTHTTDLNTPAAIPLLPPNGRDAGAAEKDKAGRRRDPFPTWTDGRAVCRQGHTRSMPGGRDQDGRGLPMAGSSGCLELNAGQRFLLLHAGV